MTEFVSEPVETATVALDRFLQAFTAATVPGLVHAFWPDALVWGTTMVDLATDAEAIKAYFEGALGQRAPGERRARWLGGSTLAASATTVLIAGTWQTETADGTIAAGPFRLSVALTGRSGEWRISQFHNSLRPTSQ